MPEVSVPEGWELISIGEVAEAAGGYGFPKNFQGKINFPFPFIKVSDMNSPDNETYVSTAANTVDIEILNTIGARTYRPGTIIFPKIGGAIATNKKRILGVEATFDNNVMGIIANQNKLLDKWCFYYLQSIDLMQMANTGPVPSIRQSSVQDLLIPIPYPNEPERSLAEQRRIVVRIEALLAEVREMRALQEGIDRNCNRLLDAFLGEVFAPLEMAAWPNRESLGELAEITARQVDPTLPEYRNMPHIYGATIEEGTGRLLEFNSAAEDGMTSGKYHFRAGAVLYSKIRPYLRKATIVDFDGLCSADMYPLQLKTSEVRSEFLMWSLLSPPFTAYANELSRRARMPKLNRPQLFAYVLAYPQPTVQDHITAMLQAAREEIYEMQKDNRDQEESLTQLEQAILAQAFRGEL